MPGEGKFVAVLSVIHPANGACLHGLVHDGECGRRAAHWRPPFVQTDGHGVSGRF
jgi:hypothetical protein